MCDGWGDGMRWIGECVMGGGGGMRWISECVMGGGWDVVDK